MTGVVNESCEAVLSLTVQGPGGQELGIEAMIDTGFNGSLTLPRDLVEELELPFLIRENALLGDGSSVVMDIHYGLVKWEGRLRRVSVHVADLNPLVGMGFLYGNELKIQVVEGGEVSLRSLRLS